MQSIEYKKYTIIAKPRQLDAPMRWSLEIEISREDDETGAVHTKRFDAANTFLTEDDAVQHCFEFGRRIVDGEVPGIPRSALP